MHDHRRAAVIAMRRFGIGPKPDELRVVRDPRDWLLDQIKRGQAAPPSTGGQDLPDTEAVVDFITEWQRRRKAGETIEFRTAPQVERSFFLPEVLARFERGVRTQEGLEERLTWFWSNHFSVARSKALVVGATVGALEREAIRPRVFGRFGEMLQAVVRHPAMLVYLDNDISFGPASPAGLAKGKGLNENLGREILELHTLGVEGGYSQQDVTEFSKALTGWRYARSPTGGAEPWFQFVSWRHEPGAVTVLGKRYPQEGEGQAAAILDDLAVHPSTARFICGKLARHFVSDSPPAGLVSAMEREFMATEGDLAAVLMVLCDSEAAWSEPPKKVLPPFDFAIAAVRAIGLEGSPAALNRIVKVFGQALWEPPSPAGWPDKDDAWASPSALLARVAWAERLGAAAPDFDVAARAREVLGPFLREETADAIGRAESRAQAVAVLLMSPEFQKR